MSDQTRAGTATGRRLVPVDHLAHSLQYHEQGLAGAGSMPWLETEAADRLTQVNESLRPLGFGLLIWDAWRSRATQQAIADRYRDELLATGMSAIEACSAVGNFIANPDGIFPHGTGGVVDLTLARDGIDADCGTGFDEFSDRSHRDWFVLNPPADELTARQRHHRELLQSHMEAQGFVGLPHEWWHFEWGSRRWAAMTEQEPILTEVLQPVD